MAILYNFEIKLNQLLGAVGHFLGACANKEWMVVFPAPCPPGAESHHPGRVGGRSAGPIQSLKSRIRKSDPKCPVGE